MSATTSADLLANGQRYYLPVYRPREVILERGGAHASGTARAGNTWTSPPASRSAD